MSKTFHQHIEDRAKIIMIALLILDILALIFSKYYIIFISLSSFLILGSFYLIMKRAADLRNKDITVSSMLRLSQATLNAESKEALYRTILEEVIDAIDAAHKGSMITIDELGYLNFEAVVGFDLEAAKELNMRFEESFLFKSITDKIPESIVIDNISLKNENLLTDDNAEVMKRVGIDTVEKTICVPITLGKKIFGMINIDSSSDQGFSDENIKLIEKFAVEISKIVRLHELFNSNTSSTKVDPLTQAYNREFFTEKVNVLLNDEEDVEKKIVYFDIDKLKSINKKYGFGVGDQVLVHFVKGMKSQIYGHEIISRYGGDEFVMLFTRKNSSLENFLARCVKWFEEHPYQNESDSIHIEFSYGFAVYNEDSLELNGLIRLANERMEIAQNKEYCDG